MNVTNAKRPDYKIKGSTNARRKAYKRYLRDMVAQGLANMPDGSWGGYTRVRSHNGGNKTWKALYCGTHPHAPLPAFDCQAKVRKGAK